ncbi:MAG: hypothetical protein ACKOYN_07265, partial [Planctomycetota bacterium]
MAAPQGTEARRTEAERSRRVKALAASLVVHVLIAVAILGTAWGISAVRERQVPAVILTADFLDPAPRAPRRAPAGESATDAPASPRSEASAADLSERLRALEAASGANAE